MDLHRIVDSQFARLRGRGKNAHRLSNAWQVTILHTMIDSGQIESFLCQSPQCKLPLVPLRLDQRGKSDSLELDHITPIHLGGLYRLENLRITHLACNRDHSDQTRAKISEGLKRAYAEGRR